MLYEVITNINIRRGEVVGIAGLMGAGRTELAMSIFGKSYGKRISGQVFMHGNEVHLNDINTAIESGLAYVTEDRKHYGLILIDDIKRNISLSNLKKLSKFGRITSYNVCYTKLLRCHLWAQQKSQKLFINAQHQL